jgi:hypothetical protein
MEHLVGVTVKNQLLTAVMTALPMLPLLLLLPQLQLL